MQKLVPLFAMYFAQGLPFGVQSSALPLLLRQRGASLQTIGFASLLFHWSPLLAVTLPIGLCLLAGSYALYRVR